MSQNIQEKLLDEIERVVQIRATYEALLDMPGVNVKPAIMMMTGTINMAKVAASGGDPTDIIQSIKALEEYEQ